MTTLVMPPVLLIAFVGLAGHHATFLQDGRKISVAQFYVPGLVASAVVASSFGSLLGAASHARGGVMLRRCATCGPHLR